MAKGTKNTSSTPKSKSGKQDMGGSSASKRTPPVPRGGAKKGK